MTEWSDESLDASTNVVKGSDESLGTFATPDGIHGRPVGPPTRRAQVTDEPIRASAMAGLHVREREVAASRSSAGPIRVVDEAHRVDRLARRMAFLRDYDYELPPEQIAQQPAAEREQARLYLLPRHAGEARHAQVADLPALLDELAPGALLVVNDTRVIPARLRAHKESGGRAELLLVTPLGAGESSTEPSEPNAALGKADGERWSERWLCLGGASKPLRPGQVLTLDGGEAQARITAVRAQQVEVEFRGQGAGGLVAVAERIGEVPLPPYIKRPDGPSALDAARYQTVYARVPGSAAAPTAGLHLTPPLLADLRARGVEHAAVTLHVGLGTFAPLALADDADVAELTELHAERYVVPDATIAAVARARGEGRKVIAVGTTSVRALESAALAAEREGTGPLRRGPGVTRLCIGPAHRFRAVDGMLTNFHLPRSSLLLLVGALAGRERLLGAYRDAVARGYRFYSYGDAMLVI